jgi:AcrR family transcriptional regulator
VETIAAVVAEGPTASGAVRRKRGRPRDPEADHRILAAASALLLERGFDTMTVDEVASRARVGKATVYRRWAKKEDLAVAAMSQLYKVQMPIPDTGSFREDVRQSYRDTIRFANSPAGAAFLRATVVECARDPRIAALYRTASAEITVSAAQMYQRGIERGEVRADVNVEFASTLLGGVLAHRIISAEPMPSEDEVEDMVAFLLRAVEA